MSDAPLSQVIGDFRPKITVLGIGGAGGNAVNNMIEAGLSNVEFIVANTEAQSLYRSLCKNKISLGSGVLGAGANPDVGRKAAEDSIDTIKAAIAGSHMLFIAAGMGGGTGTGAAPVVAKAAMEMGILTIAVVTKPFNFEGSQRALCAEVGIEALEEIVDSLIVISNQGLFRVTTEKTTFADAFKMADEVLYDSIRCITDLITVPGLINLDFADVQSILANTGRAVMGSSRASGPNRAILAAETAMVNPLLDSTSISEAKGVLINITGGYDLTLLEVDEIVNKIFGTINKDNKLIVGAIIDKNITDEIRVSIVASGLKAREQRTKTTTSPKPSLAAVAPEAITTPAYSLFDNKKASLNENKGEGKTTTVASTPLFEVHSLEEINPNTHSTDRNDVAQANENTSAPYLNSINLVETPLKSNYQFNSTIIKSRGEMLANIDQMEATMLESLNEQFIPPEPKVPDKEHVVGTMRDNNELVKEAKEFRMAATQSIKKSNNYHNASPSLPPINDNVSNNSRDSGNYKNMTVERENMAKMQNSASSSSFNQSMHAPNNLPLFNYTDIEQEPILNDDEDFTAIEDENESQDSEGRGIKYRSSFFTKVANVFRSKKEVKVQNLKKKINNSNNLINTKDKLLYPGFSKLTQNKLTQSTPKKVMSRSKEEVIDFKQEKDKNIKIIAKVKDSWHKPYLISEINNTVENVHPISQEIIDIPSYSRKSA